MEAEALVRETREPMRWSAGFSRNPVVRRKFLKQLAYRLPFRPALVFCYLYFARMGFLDGMPGWHYCRLRAMYELHDRSEGEGKYAAANAGNAFRYGLCGYVRNSRI